MSFISGIFAPVCISVQVVLAFLFDFRLLPPRILQVYVKEQAGILACEIMPE